MGDQTMTSQRKCAKCGAEATTTFAQSPTSHYCGTCFGNAIRLKFRSALSKPKRFRIGSAKEAKPTSALIVGEADTRLQALLQLIDEAQNEKEAKKRFAIDAKVCLSYTIVI